MEVEATGCCCVCYELLIAAMGVHAVDRTVVGEEHEQIVGVGRNAPRLVQQLVTRVTGTRVGALGVGAALVAEPPLLALVTICSSTTVAVNQSKSIALNKWCR